MLVLERLQALLKRFFGEEAGSPADREAVLPFEVYLTTGLGALRLFPSGAIDEFRFFQRSGVPAGHGVEFLSRLDPQDAGTEDYKPYGLFRLDPSRCKTLFDPDSACKLWNTLQQVYGLARVPDATAFARGEFTAHSPGCADEYGANRLIPVLRARGLAKRGRKRLTYAEILDALRTTMKPREKIAWIEDSFHEPPATGEIVHRYYLGTNQQAYLVRHHWSEGKRLFQAETSAEAIKICLSSGHFTRPRSACA